MSVIKQLLHLFLLYQRFRVYCSTRVRPFILTYGKCWNSHILWQQHVIGYFNYQVTFSRHTH